MKKVNRFAGFVLAVGIAAAIILPIVHWAGNKIKPVSPAVGGWLTS